MGHIFNVTINFDWIRVPESMNPWDSRECKLHWFEHNSLKNPTELVEVGAPGERWDDLRPLAPTWATFKDWNAKVAKPCESRDQLS